MPSFPTDLLDRLIVELDHGLRTTAARPRASGSNPAGGTASTADGLSEEQCKLSANLMRVNHAGEIAAQALYRGQAFVARDAGLREHLLDAADEEARHLAWCEERVSGLGSHESRLTPLWYAGSFAIGILGGLAGDRFSLGFLAETEQQVCDHLDEHLERLPAGDEPSRAILKQMRDDELRHGSAARSRGGIDLPEPVRQLMRASSKVMTALAFRI